MTPLSPMDLDLLDFLCICAEKKIKVVRINKSRLASLERLREAGQVGPNDYLPSGPALLRWIERQAHPKSSEIANRYTRESRHAFGDQRCGLSDSDREALSKIKPGDSHPPLSYKAFPPIAETPSPKPDDAVLPFFSRDWELLRFPAKRWGGGSVHNLRGIALRLRKRGLLEMQWHAEQSLWRLAEQNTKGASGTVKEAPSATSSGAAKRIEDRAPTKEPAPAVAPTARARLRVSRPSPAAHANEAQAFQRQVQRAMRTNRAAAEAFLDSGKTSAQATSVSLKIEARKVELARIETARLEDPIEQAKTIIRRAGWVCFSAIISGGPVGKFYIGTRLVTEAQLLAQAEQLRARRRVG